MLLGVSVRDFTRSVDPPESREGGLHPGGSDCRTSNLPSFFGSWEGDTLLPTPAVSDPRGDSQSLYEDPFELVTHPTLAVPQEGYQSSRPGLTPWDVFSASILPGQAGVVRIGKPVLTVALGID